MHIYTNGEKTGSSRRSDLGNKPDIGSSTPQCCRKWHFKTLNLEEIKKEGQKIPQYLTSTGTFIYVVKRYSSEVSKLQGISVNGQQVMGHLVVI